MWVGGERYVISASVSGIGAFTLVSLPKTGCQVLAGGGGLVWYRVLWRAEDALSCPVSVLCAGLLPFSPRDKPCHTVGTGTHTIVQFYPGLFVSVILAATHSKSLTGCQREHEANY